MRIFLVLLIIGVIDARRNETRAAERREKKKHRRNKKKDDQLIVAITHDDIHLVKAEDIHHQPNMRTDSHTEDWEDQDECDNDRYEEHGEGM